MKAILQQMTKRWEYPAIVFNLILVILIACWTIMWSKGRVLVERSTIQDSTLRQYSYPTRTNLQCPSEYLPNSTGYFFHLSKLSQYSPLNFTNATSTEHTESVLILTPISNSNRFLDHYFRLLCSLTYPHHLISVALGEDSSRDDTLKHAQVMAKRFRPYFKEIRIFHHDTGIMEVPYNKRHVQSLQLERRGHMARSRNQLLMRAISNEAWVLWIDVDIGYFPPNVIQHLLSAEQPVVAPTCLKASEKEGKILRYTIYDKNSWRETNESLEYLSSQPEDYLQVEGYGATYREFLGDIINEGPVVPLDGVGGCVLLVKGSCHRDGLVFPPFVFDHHIETEGLAKMAAKMDIPVYGMPFLNTVHS